MLRINYAGDLMFAPLMRGLMGGSTASSSSVPSKPRVVRMPTNSDPSVLAAGARARSNLLRGKGRLSTIMTDMTRSITGSGGRLGA